MGLGGEGRGDNKKLGGESVMLDQGGDLVCCYIACFIFTIIKTLTWKGKRKRNEGVWLNNKRTRFQPFLTVKKY